MTRQAVSAQVIDVHAHAVLTETMGCAGAHGPEIVVGDDGVQTFRTGAYRMRGARYLGSPFTDLALRLARMDRAGIDLQVVGPNPLTYFHHIPAADALRFCRVHNDAMAALVARSGGRLLGLAALPVQDPALAADELARAVNDLGLVGAQIGTDGPHPLDSPAMDALYGACVELDTPLFLHPANAGIDGPPGDPALSRFDLGVTVGYAAQETIAAATLIFGGVTARHPALDICLSHGGGSVAFLVGRLAQAARLRPWVPAELRADGAFEAALARLWFDTHVGDSHALVMLRRIADPARLVVGTNFAGWDSGEAHVDRDPALRDNALRLLRIGHGPVAAPPRG